MRRKTRLQIERQRIQRSFLRKNYRVLVPALVVMVGLLIVEWLILEPPVRDLVVGGIVGASAVGVWAYVVLLSGSINHRFGSWGEEFTRDEMRNVRRDGWAYIAGLTFGNGDIDGVAIGPGGLLALETKFIGGPTSKYGMGQRLTAAARQSKRGAHLLEIYLKSQGFPVEVFPAVVTWGAGSLDTDSIQLADGVSIIQGRHLKRWITALPHTAEQNTLKAAQTRLQERLLEQHQQLQG